MTSSSLVQLAEKILERAKMIDELTKTNFGILPNSSHLRSLTQTRTEQQQVPLELAQARLDIVDTAQELKRRVQDPEVTLAELFTGYTDTLILRAVYKLKLPQQVPTEGSTTYARIAQSVSMDETILRRFFHYAISIHVFEEPEPGHIAHTPISRLLCTNPLAFDSLGMTLEELVPASQEVLVALERYPRATEPTETGFQIVNQTDLPVYEFLAQHPERARRFGAGMRFFTQGSHLDLNYLFEAFPWREYDSNDFTVVDVGGGHGGVAIELATKTMNMHFIVQDIEGTIEAGRTALPEELKGRVTFMTHDFFSEQPISADVYFFRWIMHNWSDEYCERIIRNLLPAMKRGARILLYEHEMDETPTSRLSRKGAGYLDMVMLSGFNGCVRTESGWKKLLATQDNRLRFKGIHRVPGSAMSLVEAIWDP
ncbi:S-adenosyl-L-methionine-dependent methyltransferase [Lojkania enalia]|uniref:S-adenosyl-L-methionine-dependent methyltransferase n=1 Tax=Lojkania enalia TaxID=147567 RepID=A0A9P4K060_9PLEO|nr:S-adenosyl-L-methionine-dependent methyltransferase [Didymosphaeria enalia]